MPWSDNDYAVLAGQVVGRIMLHAQAPEELRNIPSPCPSTLPLGRRQARAYLIKYEQADCRG